MNREHVEEAQRLVKRFGELTAMDGISFEVHRAEYVGVLGSNGAARTTTIRMLYGFTPMTSSWRCGACIAA